MKTLVSRLCLLSLLLASVVGCSGDASDESDPSLNSPPPGNPKTKMEARAKAGRGGGPGSLGGPTD